MYRDVGGLVGICIQSVLYGMYLVLTAISTYSTYHIRGRKIKPNGVVMSVSAALFFTITLFYVLSIMLVFSQFIGHEDGLSSTKFQQISTISLALFAILFFANSFMDCLLTYRLYTIYLQNFRIVILPILMILIYIGNVVFLVVLCARAQAWEPDITSSSKLGIWCTITLSISVFVCLYCTSFIAYRIVQDGRAFRHFGTKNLLGPVLYVIVESAFAYCIAILTLLALYVSNSSGLFFLFAYINPLLIGVNYSLVLTYVGLGFTDISPSYKTPSAVMRSVDLQASAAPGRDVRSALTPANEPAGEWDPADCDGISVSDTGKVGWGKC